jgi:hypothetical protein
MVDQHHATAFAALNPGDWPTGDMLDRKWFCHKCDHSLIEFMRISLLLVSLSSDPLTFLKAPEASLPHEELGVLKRLFPDSEQRRAKGFEPRLHRS